MTDNEQAEIFERVQVSALPPITISDTLTVFFCESCSGSHSLLYELRGRLSRSCFSFKVFVGVFLQRLKPGTDQEENELAIMYLRQLCESKQKSHLHIGEAPQVYMLEDVKPVLFKPMNFLTVYAC